MKKVCPISEEEFEIADEDLGFYDKMGVPPPVLCPDERARRRLAWRNERKLYWRTCDITGEKTLSIYRPDSPCKRIYSPEGYWSDDWDPKDYGRDFDFSRPFFQQFIELFYEVPQLSVVLKEIENSDYCHDAVRLKDCYLIFDGEQARNCMYGETFGLIQDCMDFLFIGNSELCYECMNCGNGYHLLYSDNCKDCSNSWFLRDCGGCKDCFGCTSLHQKQYYIFNKPHTKEEFEAFIADQNLHAHSGVQAAKNKAMDFWKAQPFKYIDGNQNEDVTGDRIYNCKDCQECYDCKNLRNCKFCTNMPCESNDCYDINIWGGATELAYDSIIVGEGAQNILFCNTVAFGAKDIAYSAFCWQDVKDLFGCVGLRHSQYCIFNKQYSEEGYHALRKRIVEHMKSTKEWGEFFPMGLSPFAYNESVAQEYFPLTKEEVLKGGGAWKDEEIAEHKGPAYDIPDSINEVQDDILDAVLICQKTKKLYRIVERELEFYRKLKIPVPRLCPDARHAARMDSRNPRKLWDRDCDKCGTTVRTSFAPDRPEQVYCEKCYLEHVA